MSVHRNVVFLKDLTQGKLLLAMAVSSLRWRNVVMFELGLGRQKLM